MEGFETYILDNRINLYICPTDKFKTIVISPCLHFDLREDQVTRVALLPQVLERGTMKWPTTRELVKTLEGLYGTDIMTEVFKRGERQVLQFALEIVNPLFVPGEKDLERKAMEVLREVLTRPLLEGDGFKESYVNREKEVLKDRIEGLVNDKGSYAQERCIQEMCRGERYGNYRLGKVEDLGEVTPRGLYRFYRDALARAPLDVFVLGMVDPQKIRALVQETLDFPREETWEIGPTLVHKEIKGPRYIEERLEVNQGKLTLGYRTQATLADPDYYPLLMYSGVLGGFPHSKLFQNVREKSSLAYYAYARLEKFKGLMMIASGIEFENYDRALEIIQDQVQQMARGEIGEAELENTRVGLINQVTVSQDSPFQIINQQLEGVITGKVRETEEIIQGINRVTREDVVRVAEKVQLDTIYFLRDREQEVVK